MADDAGKDEDSVALLAGEVLPGARVSETMSVWRRAINEHWPIDPKLRQTFVDTARRVYEDPDFDPRARIAAGKLIVDVDKLNMIRARMALDVDKMNQPAAPQSQVNVQVNIGNLHSLSDAELERLIAEEEAKGG